MIVEQVMTTPVFSVKPSMSISEAVKLMLDRHFSGLPVVTEDGTLVGVISEGDFLRRAELETERKRSWFLEFLASPGKIAEEYVHSHARKVEAVMTANVVTIGPDAPLREAIDIMTRRRVKRLPVVRDGKVVGIVTRVDVLRALAGAMPAEAAADFDDEHIQAAITAELANQPWGVRGTTRVRAKDGVVTLAGTIFDERERLAVKVAAENVPGVKSVIDELVLIEPISGVTIFPPGDETPKQRSSSGS